MRYEYTTLSFPTFKSSREYDDWMEEKCWRVAWKDVTEFQTFAVYRRAIKDEESTP